MAAPRVLFVKLSSLGDVIHHLPAVSDLAGHRAGVRVEWAVEEAYAGLAGLHPFVARTIPVGLRRAKGAPLSHAGWRDLLAARRLLRAETYDFIVDTQGLLKSAVVASEARGARFGFDRASAREKVAARFYDVGVRVPRERHAVERIRQLVGEVFGYAPAGPAGYGLLPPGPPPAWAPEAPYVVLLHAASRAAKRWPDTHWTQLAAALAERGYVAVYPGGSPAEREAAARLAAATPGALAAPAMDLLEAASLLAGAQGVVGVDTGLTHLAVALGRPTIGLYVATDPARTGLYGEDAVNLGGIGRTPSVADVLRALDGEPGPEAANDASPPAIPPGDEAPPPAPPGAP